MEDEQYELVEIFSEEQIKEKRAKKCNVCGRRVACCFWKSTASNVTWKYCLDCQEDHFPEWIPEWNNFIIATQQFLSNGQIDAMITKCSASEKFAIPSFPLLGSATQKRKSKSQMQTKSKVPKLLHNSEHTASLPIVYYVASNPKEGTVEAITTKHSCTIIQSTKQTVADPMRSIHSTIPITTTSPYMAQSSAPPNGTTANPSRNSTEPIINTSPTAHVTDSLPSVSTTSPIANNDPPIAHSAADTNDTMTDPTTYPKSPPSILCVLQCDSITQPPTNSPLLPPMPVSEKISKRTNWSVEVSSHTQVKNSYIILNPDGKSMFCTLCHKAGSCLNMRRGFDHTNFIDHLKTKTHIEKFASRQQFEAREKKAKERAMLDGKEYRSGIKLYKQTSLMSFKSFKATNESVSPPKAQSSSQVTNDNSTEEGKLPPSKPTNLSCTGVIPSSKNIQKGLNLFARYCITTESADYRLALVGDSLDWNLFSLQCNDTGIPREKKNGGVRCDSCQALWTKTSSKKTKLIKNWETKLKSVEKCLYIPVLAESDATEMTNFTRISENFLNERGKELKAKIKDRLEYYKAATVRFTLLVCFEF